jgi:hypothetical protein
MLGIDSKLSQTWELKRRNGSFSTNCKRRGTDGPGEAQTAHFLANRCRTSGTIEEGEVPPSPRFRLSYLPSSTLCRRLHFGRRGVLLAVWIRAEVLFDP